MKKSIKLIIIILIITIVIIVGIFIIRNKKQTKDTYETNNGIAKVDTNEEEENIIVVGIGNKKEEVEQEKPKEEPKTKEEKPKQDSKQEQEPVQEQEKDAATLTQEIYKLNRTIGTLRIPKTKLTTEVYCNSDTKKMEKMPAFLYTTGGLNKTGITLIVGHNRRNGKMFSNNKKLQNGDEFYFKDYTGEEKKYTIYAKFTTTSDDTSFLNDKVDKPVIALSCCTDASDDNRIIILGEARN